MASASDPSPALAAAAALAPERRLQPWLAPDEQLVWSGRPAPGRFERSAGATIAIFAVVGVIGLGVVLWGLGNGDARSIGLGAIFLSAVAWQVAVLARDARN